ncbi:MAG: hypothetical protein ACOCUU_01985 [Nanoarchaeota archaeon]
MGNIKFEKMVKKIAESSGQDIEEIKKKVEAKRNKLSGLISEEGAAQVIAAELGVNLEDERYKIKEISDGMKRVNLIGKVLRVFPVNTFQRNGKENKVCNLIVADETSNTRAVLWDVNHIDLIEKQQIGEGSVIEISNASVRQGDVHLGSFSELKISSEDMGEVKEKKDVEEKPVVEFSIGDAVKTRAFIVQTYPLKFFEVCPECKKKVFPTEDGTGKECKEHGKVTPEKRALMSAVIDDGTENTRIVMFHETLQELGIREINDENKAKEQVENILGEEKKFSGYVKMNTYFNNPELVVQNIEDVNLDELI